MTDVNSIRDFENLKRSLEAEDRLIKDVENDIRRKEADHKKAKDAFERVDRELSDLNKKKQELVHRRTTLELEVKNLQRSLDDLKRRGNIPLKL